MVVNEAIDFSASITKAALVNQFQEHVDPLKMKFFGEVFIIGPGTFLQELALLEPQHEKITNITMITSLSLTRFQTDYLKKFQQIYPNLPVEILPDITYQGYLTTHERNRYDVIVFIGGHPTTLTDKDLDLLVSRINPGGAIYATVNDYSPVRPPSINHHKATTVNLRQTNPFFPYEPGYYGLVVR
ncbi:MAG: hypothetical protein NTZ93_05080 [Candidatus Beckwithbacteria bacterium]|nr:hypothetical protein [Candidatus Beckwithbacteria bacterium]